MFDQVQTCLPSLFFEQRYTIFNRLLCQMSLETQRLSVKLTGPSYFSSPYETPLRQFARLIKASA